MTCAQLGTKRRTSVLRKMCYVKSGFQILYAVEQFSLFFLHFQDNFRLCKLPLFMKFLNKLNIARVWVKSLLVGT